MRQRQHAVGVQQQRNLRLHYDDDDRLTQVTEPFGVTLNFAYDADGNQTQVIDSFGGTQTSYYDSDNYLTETTYSGQSLAARIDFTNNKDGEPTTIARYSDLAGTTLVATTDEGYDGDGNVTSIYTTDASSTVLQNYSYTFNSVTLRFKTGQEVALQNQPEPRLLNCAS